jgi:hypothetical protein
MVQIVVSDHNMLFECFRGRLHAQVCAFTHRRAAVSYFSLCRKKRDGLSGEIRFHAQRISEQLSQAQRSALETLLLLACFFACDLTL